MIQGREITRTEYRLYGGSLTVSTKSPGTDITVLIPARNGEAYIAAAVESVLAQTFERWRLVVSDDASTDGTREVVRRYTGDPRVELIESSVNLGLAGNWNRCLENVRSDYFMTLCQDDLLWAPDALETAHRILSGDPGIPAVYCDLLFVDGAGRRLMNRGFRRSGLVDSACLARRSVLQTRNAFGVALLFRTEASRGVRYDPALALVIDVDFSIATAQGRPIYHVPRSLIGYRYHGKNQTGVLLDRLVHEMTYVAAKHRIPLRAHHRALMRIAGYCTNTARRAVLWYARSRSRVGHS
jgi:glycosyltransferase involved in cell wall biosynthesis